MNLLLDPSCRYEVRLNTWHVKDSIAVAAAKLAFMAAHD
jgi:hypothetical protein